MTSKKLRTVNALKELVAGCEPSLSIVEMIDLLEFLNKLHEKEKHKKDPRAETYIDGIRIIF